MKMKNCKISLYKVSMSAAAVAVMIMITAVKLSAERKK